MEPDNDKVDDLAEKSPLARLAWLSRLQSLCRWVRPSLAVQAGVALASSSSQEQPGRG